jgi:hypothetical protein
MGLDRGQIAYVIKAVPNKRLRRTVLALRARHDVELRR